MKSNITLLFKYNDYYDLFQEWMQSRINGTLKIEIIKDLSRSLRKYIIAFNCSNNNSSNIIQTIFLSVINIGAWA